MIDSTTPLQATDPAEIRAERRRLVESVGAHRRLLAERRPFELADRRRLNREAGERARAQARHGKALQRVHEKQARSERSLTGRLNGLDDKRVGQERRALAVLRRESIERSLHGTRLTASEVNGIGSGLVRDLAAQGIRTAADFKRVSWGKAPNGRGGEVLYIHRTQGRKVHINGIGEHRGRPLTEWRRSAVARAEARAPKELPPDERHRIEEIIENERVRLQAELAEVPKAAGAARAEAGQLHAERLAVLTGAQREAGEEAARRRAEFDEMAERLIALRAELAAHVDLYGDLGFRDRRARSRALRPVPDVPPAIPAPRAPDPEPGSGPKTGADAEAHADGEGDAKVREGGEDREGAKASAFPSTPGIRASLGWLVPVVFFGMTAVSGAGETDATPLWCAVATRLVSLAVTVELLRLWIPRRNWRTADAMPGGTGFLASGAFLGLVAASMFTDPLYAADSAPWALAVVAALLVAAGAVRRAGAGPGTSG
ncbi:hypothetical protein [Streptomyces sp. TLI_105]|uniref:hypothetical protein n=1 Tax=Streptomyces sp. TLI_105 TaxID=1881019 RepID=UPI000894F351|nr:hypothetical protein [Streptomyces sp. TLI_105]SED94650.1 hypothetical protein SAMN05428939_6823 [Streptomyces sp. TLI_105]